MKLVHGSLFSGFDAPSVAASWMGWKNAFHCEINLFCNEILKYWFPNSEHYEDITKTDFSQWKGKIDVLTGGFPCQPFSLAGQRKGADDNRYLWPHMLRTIQEIRPAWVIGENVAGILTMVQPGKETEVGSQTSLFGEDNRKRILLRKNMLSKPSVKTLSEKDIPSNRCLFRLVPLERPIEETECGLLPTVQTQGLKMCDEQGKTTFYPLEMLPTPTARSYKNGSKLEDGRTKRKQEQGWTMELNDLAICGMLPTPTTRDYKSSISPNGMMRKNGKLRNDTLSNIPVMLGEHCTQRPGTTSQLNPLFVEEMMGFPLMWTTLPFLSQNGDRNQLKDMETP